MGFSADPLVIVTIASLIVSQFHNALLGNPLVQDIILELSELDHNNTGHH